MTWQANLLEWQDSLVCVGAVQGCSEKGLPLQSYRIAIISDKAGLGLCMQILCELMITSPAPTMLAHRHAARRQYHQVLMPKS